MSTLAAPRISVVIPARNEAGDIEACLRRVIEQADETVEIIVVDGQSTDATRDHASRILSSAPGPWRVITNPEMTTPSSLNAGLAAASGTFLCRVDARSLIPPGYLERCAAVLATRPDVAVVGGAQIATPRSAQPRAVGIARALNNPYGMGLARYRRGARSGPADTVYLGCFRREELVRMGGWDERFATNQDYELNRRMAAIGVVWFEADLDVGYLPRATIGSLLAQYHRFGRWKVAYWRYAADRPRARQVALLAAPAVGALTAAALVRRSRRTRVAAGVAGVAGAWWFESRSVGPPGSVAARLSSLVASTAVGAGWTSGVWREAARPTLSLGSTRDR